jgi:hypothetical protein
MQAGADFVVTKTSRPDDFTVGGNMLKTSKGLQDPVKLKRQDKETGRYQVIVETPKGSRNKFAYDPDLRIFALKKVLPTGMTFPYEFGASRKRKRATVIPSMSCC